jgi:hypothetical protein
MSDAAVVIRKNDDGTIDEIIANSCSVHVEQMDTSSWYMGIDAADGSYWQFWFGAKNGRSAVEFRHTETFRAPKP